MGKSLSQSQSDGHSRQSLLNGQAVSGLHAPSVLFNRAAVVGPDIESLRTAIATFHASFLAAQGGMEAGQILDQQAGLEEIQAAIAETIKVMRYGVLESHKHQITDWLNSLDDPELPDIGRIFLGQQKRVGCSTTIEPSLECAAEYTAYSYANGLRNNMGLNPEKIRHPFDLFDSIMHELPHALQRDSAQALQHGPFNPDTKIIVHPDDWILLYDLCERDAYAMQAWFNSLLNKKQPYIREKTQFYVLSVQDFETIRDESSDLAECLKKSALAALKKPKRNWASYPTFADHYHDVAIRNYSAGMCCRRDAGETGHIFVRLTQEDFWAVGNYGVGPNRFGEHSIDPAFLQRPELDRQNSENLQLLYRDYNIPPLASCPTLNEVLWQTRQAPTVGTTALIPT